MINSTLSYNSKILYKLFPEENDYHRVKIDKSTMNKDRKHETENKMQK